MRAVQVVFTGLSQQLSTQLNSYGLSQPLVEFADTIDLAMQKHLPAIVDQPPDGGKESGSGVTAALP